MALTFGFYNSVEGDRVYDAVQFGQIFDGIITDGIYATYKQAMVVKASENAGEVIIQPGRAWFNHTWSYNDADLVMQAPSPEVLLDRVDALVLDINEEQNVRTNSFIWVQGIPASVNPSRPTLIHTTTHNQYPLCYVRRHAETTMIYTEDITNMVGTSECPFVAGVLEGVDVDIWLAQWDAQFHTWENAQQTAFETWFDHMKDQLDSDAAGHLQSEIDDINTDITGIKSKNTEQDSSISSLGTRTSNLESRMSSAESAIGVNSQNIGGIATRMGAAESGIAELDNRTHVANAAANSNFYFDYQGGKWGFNTSAARGADTFHPFRSDPTTDNVYVLFNESHYRKGQNDEGGWLPAYGTSGSVTVPKNGVVYIGGGAGDDGCWAAEGGVVINGTRVWGDGGGGHSHITCNYWCQVTAGSIITFDFHANTGHCTGGYCTIVLFSLD